MSVSVPPPRLQVRTAQASRAGRKPDNEDALGIRVPDGHLLASKGVALVLADGVSGAGGGRQAAEVAVQGFLTDYYATPESWSVKTSGERVLSALNRWLHGQNPFHEAQAPRGFLTTFSALVLRAQSAYLFHVGDARIQRLREGVLEPLTHDHNTRLGTGRVCLTRALGLHHQVEIDFRVLDLRPGDVFLLSSDGLHDFLPRARLHALLADAADDPEAGCTALLEAALAAGSHDNLSCQIAVVVSVPPPGADDSCVQAAQLPLLPLLAVGQCLDGLRVEAELHATARSQLYRVRDEDSGRCYVLKAPAPRCEDGPELRARFALEDWTGQRLQHRHLVRGMAPPRPRSGLYLLQEYLEGETLAAWHRRQPLPPAQTVVALAAQAVRGLQALHRRETLHLDIKPENLFLGTDGMLRLIDFGAVRVASRDEAPSATPPGAAEYAAPECRLLLPCDERADQFSLAVTLYELLTGQHPYGEAYVRARTRFDFQRLRYTSACRYNPHVPLWLDGALRKALSLAPMQRYDALSEFLADLERPNPQRAPGQAQAWLERDPVGFWRALALLMTALALAELLWLLFPH